MSSAERASAHSSATTSANAQANPSELTEAQFLQQQAELAKQAIANTWKHVTSELGQGINPAGWTREHPWAVLGAAAVAGFVAATQLVPSKEEQALKKLAALERALHASARPAATGPTDGENGRASDKEPARHGILYGLLNEALKAIQPALISMITAKVASGETQEAHAQGAAAAQGQPPPPQA
jgi:hypothetical protein